MMALEKRTKEGSSCSGEVHLIVNEIAQTQTVFFNTVGRMPKHLAKAEVQPHGLAEHMCDRAWKN